MHKLNVFIFGGFFSTNAATVLCREKVDSQVLKQLAGDNQQNVFNWLESLQIPEPQRTNEGNYLLLFLIAEEWLQVASAALCQRFAEIQQLNRDLLSYLKIQFQLSEEVLQGFEQKVTIVHFKLFHFPIEANYSYLKMDITYFAETYTEYFSASRQFIQEQNESRCLGCQTVLFYRYLLLMVDALPLKKFWLRLHCVSTFPLVKPIIV